METPFVIIITLGILGQTSRAVYLDRVAEQWSDDDFVLVGGDELINEAAEYEIGKIDAAAVTIPSKMEAVVQFGYDQGMKDRLAAVGTDNFAAFITAVATHTQAHYRHASLGTVIELKVC